MRTVIKVENLSKQYRLGRVGSGSLKDDMKRWGYKIMRKDDPFLIMGEENDRTIKGSSEYVWALNNINFEIKQGDIVGIIGNNGAGKSTLLKILSRITGPTTGTVKIKGRIASLLEVGTGFHAELSGRENIFLNGAILGMNKVEITKKLDEIISFADIERYIDTPVKRYSSGMYVRLAFAVAAHLEPDIMIVDEVLAVGDTEFQKKCLGKMKEVSNIGGRTVLFVSHSMAAVQKLCNTGILLKNGKVDFVGNIENVISKYLESKDASQSVYEITKPVDTPESQGFAYRLQVEDTNGNLINEIPVGKPWQVRVKFRLVKKVNHFIIALGLTNELDINLRTTWSKEADLTEGDYEAVFKENDLLFSTGTYHIAIGLSSYERAIHYVENVASITISDITDFSLDKTIVRTSGTGLLLNPMNVEIYQS